MISAHPISIVIPTLNAASNWDDLVGIALLNATPNQVIIIDSSSCDATASLALAAGFHVHTIPRSEFNHGGTRQLAAELLPDAEILIYMTQDAILASPESISELVKAFDDPSVGAAYGRQLPHVGAKPIEAHARLFNYPDRSVVRALDSRRELGLKSIFISNSFAAYRREALMAIGGFPTDTIFGEDTMVAARMLLAGWKTAYVATATVHHSHSYSFRQDFRRYFDIGVLHQREHWLLDEFGSAGGEGLRFVKSEMAYLWPKYWWLIPSAWIRTGLKFLGYRLGRMESRISLKWKRKLSMHPSFWRP